MAPEARTNHVSVWTGNEMLIWGGSGAGGGRYDPAVDAWRSIDVNNVHDRLLYQTAVWTGNEMLIFGGWGGGPAPPYNETSSYIPGKTMFLYQRL